MEIASNLSTGSGRSWNTQQTRSARFYFLWRGKLCFWEEGYWPNMCQVTATSLLCIHSHLCGLWGNSHKHMLTDQSCDHVTRHRMKSLMCWGLLQQELRVGSCHIQFPFTNWAWVPGCNPAQPALVPSCFRDSLDFHLWKELTSSHIKIM